MKTAVVALFAAALIAAAPAVFAHGPSSKSPRVHHISSKKFHRGVSPYALRPEMQTTGMRRSYPGGGGGGTTSMEPNPNAGGGGGY